MGKRLKGPAKRAPALRHLRWEDFESRVNRGPPSTEPVAGAPRADLFIEPGGLRIGLRIYAEAGSVVASPLEEIAIRQVLVGGELALEISTGNHSLYKDFHALCCAIADRVQLKGQPLASAVGATLDSWAALIRRKALLSEKRQIGLLGELLFLQRTAKVVGWETAAASWLGPDSEEHDFVLPANDVEVKTTRSERRVHEISSLIQLAPKAQRRLWMLSVQLTSGGKSNKSFSLASMVSVTLSLAAQSGNAAVDRIRYQICRQGWEDEDAVHYAHRYCLRSPMMAARVDDHFPAIVPGTLSSLGAHCAARIQYVSYSIDVTGLGVEDGTKSFNQALFGK
jgi:hypothetical protein